MIDLSKTLTGKHQYGTRVVFHFFAYLMFVQLFQLKIDNIRTEGLFYTNSILDKVICRKRIIDKYEKENR